MGIFEKIKKIDWNKPIEIKIEKKYLDRMYDVLEYIYLAIFAIYIAKLVFDKSMLTPEIPFYFFSTMNKVLFLVVALKILSSLDKYKKLWLPLAFLGIIALIMYFYGEYEDQLYMYLFAVGAVGVPYRKIIKNFFWSSLWALLVIMCSSFTGLSTFLIYVKKGSLRYCFGVCYPTTFAAIVLFTTLAGWVAYGKNREKLMCVIFVLEAVFLYKLSNAWCSSMVAICAAIMSLYLLWYRKTDGGVHIKKFVWFAEKSAFLVFGTIMNVLTLAYSQDNSLLCKLDRIISGRLKLGRRAFDEYGIHAFGKYYVMIGQGYSDVGHPDNYNAVDSTYCWILVRYGVVLLIVLTLLYIYTLRGLEKNDEILAATVMALIALHSMIEERWVFLAFNPFLIIFFSNLSSEAENTETYADAENTRGHMIRKIVFVIALIAAVVGFPRFISVVRTFQNVNLTGLSYENDIYILYVLALLMSFGCFTYGMLKKESVREFIITGLSGLVLILVSTLGINYYWQSQYVAGIKANTDLCTMIDTAEELNCSLYVETVPEYFKAAGFDVEDEVIQGNALAKKENLLLVTETEKEYYRLLGKGFIYCEISENCRIYTDNEELIKKLQDAGYRTIDKFED